jgi:hypothetical protein
MSGPIALCALVLQITIVHLTIKPAGYAAILFFLGEIIVSLIVGYGYEALKFKPLLNLYADTIKRKTKLFNLIHDVQYVIRITCRENHE